jgi:hypothetical protein
MNRCLMFLIVPFVLALPAFSQTTILNIPSTDVVAPRKIYVEMDFITNYAWERDDYFQNYLPRVVIGAGKHVEVGANLSYTKVRGGSEPIELQPNAKWQFFSNEETGVAAALGCIWYLPITKRAGTDAFAQCYSTVSKEFSGRLGPRFTGGGYVLLNARDQKTKRGVLAGYQQPFSKQTGFVLDWASGENRFGYVSPGLYWLPSANSSLSAGYAIANKGRGRNALFAYYGIQF